MLPFLNPRSSATWKYCPNSKRQAKTKTPKITRFFFSIFMKERISVYKNTTAITSPRNALTKNQFLKTVAIDNSIKNSITVARKYFKLNLNFII